MKFLQMIKKIGVVFFATLIIVISACGCASNNGNDNSSPKGDGKFWVTFLDVGQGDCAVIKFPDDKVMMIDCGNSSSYSISSIESFLETSNLEHIDYLLLSHPDIDHVGGAKTVLDKVKVGKVFLPEIANPSIFPTYESAFNTIKQKGVQTAISEKGLTIRGEDYIVVFMAPSGILNEDSPYQDFNLTNQPTEDQTNDISAVVYVECKGVRFLFTGDISSVQEQKIIKDFSAGLFDNYGYEKGGKLNLYNIDFLKVAHHGSEFSSCLEFLSLLTPKNAVISVGGTNSFGHPSSLVLQRLLLTNENCNLLRTDAKGSITVNVFDNGETSFAFDK